MQSFLFYIQQMSKQIFSVFSFLLIKIVKCSYLLKNMLFDL